MVICLSNKELKLSIIIMYEIKTLNHRLLREMKKLKISIIPLKNCFEGGNKNINNMFNGSVAKIPNNFTVL